MKMTLSEELLWRGQIKDKTFDDIKWLDEPRVFYLGSDASADSLTIGNLAIYMLARRLRKHGWKAVLLVGGATSLIGDPGGKEEERDLKSRKEIEANVAGVAKQVKRLFSGMDFTLVDNYSWFKDVGYLEFLRDVGKNFSMTELLQRDFISSRIGEGGSGISYAEFSYSLIQGYDYWHLFRKYDVELQIGGSDQWGNMLSGVPLIRKKENSDVHALSMPLVIDKTTGKKFGKSEEGAVWLDPSKTSVYKFYQFWLNIDDDSVIDHLKVYTELEKTEIDNIEKEFKSDKSARLAQKTLAYETTKLVHGENRAQSIKRVSEALFGGRPYEDLAKEDFELLTDELPFAEGRGKADLVELLIGGGLASSNTEARRFIKEGAIYINGKQIVDQVTVGKSDSLHGYVIVRRGKNSMALLMLK